MPQSQWTHYNPVRVLAGPGLLNRLAEWTPPEGRILLVTSPGFVRRGLADRIAGLLGVGRLRVFSGVTPNPDMDALDAATADLAGEAPAGLVAVGGGSVLDAAKVLSVTLRCGRTTPLHRTFREKAPADWPQGLPVIAAPTTAGTGAEATPFATVWDNVGHKKFSVAGPGVFPRTALLDPELPLSLPEEQTLYPGLDAISHALESLWNRNRTPVSEAYAARSLAISLAALPRVLAAPGDLDARARMQQASLLGGLAISQTRTAIAHSLSYPLTLRHGVPHGLACSFTLENVGALYLAQHPDCPFRDLIAAARGLLHGLDLHGHVARYADAAQIAALTGEMFTAGRAENFDGTIPDLPALLARP